MGDKFAIASLVVSLFSIVFSVYLFFWDKDAQTVRLLNKAKKIKSLILIRKNDKFATTDKHDSEKNSYKNAFLGLDLTPYKGISAQNVEKYNSLVNLVSNQLEKIFKSMDSISIFSRWRWQFWILIIRSRLKKLEKDLEKGAKPSFLQNDVQIKGTNLICNRNYKLTLNLKLTDKEKNDWILFLDNLENRFLIKGTTYLLNEFKFDFYADVWSYQYKNSINEDILLVSMPLMLKKIFKLKSISFMKLKEINKYTNGLIKNWYDIVDSFSDYVEWYFNQYWVKESRSNFILCECATHGYDVLNPIANFDHPERSGEFITLINDRHYTDGKTCVTEYISQKQFQRHNKSKIPSSNKEKLINVKIAANKYKLFHVSESSFRALSNIKVKRNESFTDDNAMYPDEGEKFINEVINNPKKQMRN